MDIFEESKMPLIPEFVHMINEHGADKYGRVFHYGEKFYRAITPEGANNILKLFRSGLIDKLQSHNFIPRTNIASLELEGYPFVLEHEKIKNVSYSYEWSFTMLKDAALMVLDVFELLINHGFTSQDAHTGNILFKDNHPVWVDVTSFIENKSVGFWMLFEYFYSIYQPLELMSINPTIARERLKNFYLPFEMNFYLNLIAKHGLKRRKRISSIFNRYMKLFYRYGSESDKETVLRGVDMFRQKIKSFKMNLPSQWAHYHHNWINNKKQVLLSDGGGQYALLESA